MCDHVHLLLLPFFYQKPPSNWSTTEIPRIIVVIHPVPFSPIYYYAVACWWWDGLWAICWSKNTPHYYCILNVVYSRGQVLTILSWFWRERSTIFPATSSSSSYAVDVCKTIHGRHCVSFTRPQWRPHHSLFILFLENTYVHVHVRTAAAADQWQKLSLIPIYKSWKSRRGWLGFSFAYMMTAEGASYVACGPLRPQQRHKWACIVVSEKCVMRARWYREV